MKLNALPDGSAVSLQNSFNFTISHAGRFWYDEKVMSTKKLNLSLFPLVLIVALIGCGGDKNSESAPVDGNGTGTPKTHGSENKETTLAEYLPGKRFEYGMSDQMKEVAAKAQNTRCMHTMRNLKTAIETWSLINKKQDAAKVTHEDLTHIMGGPATCPAGGNIFCPPWEKAPSAAMAIHWPISEEINCLRLAAR